MKYFTLDDWIADQGPECDLAGGARLTSEYRAYLASIKPRLPRDLVRLIDDFCIHDGRLRELRLDVGTATASLRLDAGDVTMREGRRISLHYTGVSEVCSTADPEKGLPGPHGFGDIGYDEVEMLDHGLVEHRFLFSSGIELLIRFRDVKLEEHSKVDQPA